ncbi:L-histidine N(alpha)-methyltransferase [candidate division TA06 bacterium]|nr:L-histidine N(alpha)-methyltransferase [candidate division TA06 bacterium]
MGIESTEFSYKQFAELGFIQQANSHLVDLVGLRPGQKVVDLGCGTGAVTRLIMEKLEGARNSLVIGIDMSAAALREAMSQLNNARNVAIHFVQSRVEHLPEIVKEQVDSVFFCNGIHLVPDKPRLLTQISTALKSGGIFAFNTTFFQGAPPPETEQFYRKWMFKALRILRRRHGIMPQKGKVEARRQLTSEQYEDLLCQHGFTIGRKSLFPALFTLQGYMAISEYEEFIQGAMPGVPLEKGRDALQEGVRQAFQDLNLETVPRNWLTVVAVRK